MLRLGLQVVYDGNHDKAGSSFWFLVFGFCFNDYCWMFNIAAHSRRTEREIEGTQRRDTYRDI